ncbi:MULTISPECIES: IclR family transcriptional regulator [unclassified Microbacterium]|uniref:IclR family transcriptional regulator n=1 Tax=unclassified Microbacterium TaxID=2609290 RepID=UPI000EA9CD49|nr:MULTISPECIES: helix-turn-helix domain-containing protein [unclassified Microbacterium]MBT2486529.1 helix-turn-helix domain-containing protein [Microbacterium sp. ISL-108]RKN69222.1 ArsR family transcriptional regulator [Microbacterium sp. CGR2]
MAPGPGTQTLARGLTALALIGEAERPLTALDVAEMLGIHRSMAYRLVRTLEVEGFVTRAQDGRLAIGARVVALARNVAGDLRSASAPELTRLANDLGMTSFVVTYDGTEAVTLASAEPQRVDAPVGQRPGSRHPIARGAPGRIIRSQLDPIAFPPTEYETSHDEIFVGLSSIAVPLRTPGAPASLALIYLTHEIEAAPLVAALQAAASRIELALQ